MSEAATTAGEVVDKLANHIGTAVEKATPAATELAERAIRYTSIHAWVLVGFSCLLMLIGIVAVIVFCRNIAAANKSLPYGTDEFAAALDTQHLASIKCVACGFGALLSLTIGAQMLSENLTVAIEPVGYTVHKIVEKVAK